MARILDEAAASRRVIGLVPAELSRRLAVALDKAAKVNRVYLILAMTPDKTTCGMKPQNSAHRPANPPSRGRHDMSRDTLSIPVGVIVERARAPVPVGRLPGAADRRSGGVAEALHRGPYSPTTASASTFYARRRRQVELYRTETAQLSRQSGLGSPAAMGNV